MNPLYKKPFLAINLRSHSQSSRISESWAMCIFKSLLVALALVFVQDGFGQSAATFNKISVTSPTASALQKFTDYPVNLNTGLVDISIPIYNINVNGINVPINFKYHASGIKYDDESEGLGLGWTMEAGGMITGIVQGNPDYQGGLNNYFKEADLIDPVPSCDPGRGHGDNINGENAALMMFDRGYGDSEYDIYNFTFPGHSGKFFYPGTSTPVISPYQNLAINGSLGGPNISAGVFDITNESGVIYKFGRYSNGGGAVEMSMYDSRSCNFMLTEIISADRADTIRFNYNIDNRQLKLVINDQVTIRDQFSFVNRSGGFDNGGSFEPRRQTDMQNYLSYFGLAQLSNITFRTGRVAFSYGNGLHLTGIKVYNTNSNTPIKAVSIQQSDYGPDYYKLDQVSFQDNQQQQSYNYKLTYNGTPYNRQWTGIDYWGYHNGEAYITDYVPNFTLPTDAGATTVGGMDRTPNELAMQQGMLQKVTYPTGGTSIFTFEAHRYNNGTSGGQIAGGLRIKQIDNYDLNGAYLNSKWYKYGQTENGGGTIYRAVYPADYCYTFLDIYQDFGLNSNNAGNYYPPTYTANERKFGAFPKFSNAWNGSSVVYDYVTEYTGDGVNANGKTVYNYENFGDAFTDTYFYANIPLVAYSNSWKTGQLLNKSIFSRSGTGYNLVSSLNNQYNDFNQKDYHCLKVITSVDWHFLNMTDVAMWNALDCYNDQNVPLSNLQLPSVHAYADYYLTTGLRELTSSTELRDGVSTTTSYTYDPAYLKPVTTVTARSDGNNIFTNFTYPFGLTAAPYPAMVANNIIEPVITKSEFKNDTSHPLESVTTNYGNWGNLYAPQSVSTQKGSDAGETRLVYDAYDNRGNILQRHRQAGAFEAYIWGYNKQYPIAEIKNASYQDVVSVLGQNVIDQLGGASPGTDDQVRALLAPLRTDSRMKNAQMTSYTYEPLVGMTSMTDAKGMTTKYEYDGFQRLLNVRDKDGNIIKHNDYHYQNQ